MSWKKGKINMTDYSKQNLKLYKKEQQEKQKENIKMEERPAWNDLKTDLSQYRSSAQEQLERKLLHVSKHSVEAKEEWRNKQNKLVHNILD